MKNSSSFIEVLVFVVSLIIFTAYGIYLSTSLGLSLFIAVSYSFIRRLGSTVDIRYLIIILSLLQWVIGPFFAYRYYSYEYGTYDMMVDEITYMNFVVFSVVFYAIGMFIPLKVKSFNTSIVRKQIRYFVARYKNIDIFFIIVGVIFNLFWANMPIQIRFFAFLLGNLHFVGLLFLLENKQRSNRKLYLIIAFIFTALSSLKAAMFHDLFLWLGFMLLFVLYGKKIKFHQKLIGVLLVVILAGTVQTVKFQYRDAVWGAEQKMDTGERLGLFTDLVSENVGGKFLTSQANINNMIVRINQGWIIARIMHHVPHFEPYAGGETISEALKATLLPRILVPRKATSGGVSNFERFTGHELQPGTSMNLSILGEAYANYGQGAFLFMFVFGFFLNYSYYFVKKLIVKGKPTLLFFIPIIYLQVIKAETDFVTVLNHLIKASVFVWIIYFGLRKFLNIKM